MRLILRFVLPLAFIFGLIGYAMVPLVDELTLKWFVRDLEMRSKLISQTLQEVLAPLVVSNSGPKVLAVLNRMAMEERIFALGFCSPDRKLRYRTTMYPDFMGCPEIPIETSKIMKFREGSLHLSTYPIFQGSLISGISGASGISSTSSLSSGLTNIRSNNLGYLVLIHDMGFIEKRSSDTKQYIAYFFLALTCIISLVTVIIAKISWRGWFSDVRAILKGEGIFRNSSSISGIPGISENPRTSSPELQPIVKDLKGLIRDLEANRKSRDESLVTWSPRILKEILQKELMGDEILIVSNREPYSHVRKGNQIVVEQPASGLVTALEPVMKACSGTWIAHGSGDADAEVVDQYDRIQVPPDKPAYTLRRVWLTEEEEKRYYFGFANEGLWPLCHIAHTRPIFRSEDWKEYLNVNQKFAEVVLQEAKTDDPVILVQDYHLALLPRIIKTRLPNATVITFWHIPWPNMEAFSICPWKNEILKGLLGSSILGFHTRYHCHNFMDTVDRAIECRIDRETSTIIYKERLTAIHNYPISIEFPLPSLKSVGPVQECRKNIRERLGLPADRLIGIGVDRLDYTKGILERFRAVERLLEMESIWIGRFTFVQIAAPSRGAIQQYRQFEQDIKDLAVSINKRFSRDGYEPIRLLIESHNHQQVYEYYRGAETCFVSSLHDGMNLVAKEFVASRDDEQGVLILSQFAGAAREFLDALIINPYDVDQSAIALNFALRMTPSEQRMRMRSMRLVIQEFNIYRWAGRMLMDASKIRQRFRILGKLMPNTKAWIENLTASWR